jgi:hypothetical protein
LFNCQGRALIDLSQKKDFLPLKSEMALCTTSYDYD